MLLADTSVQDCAYSTQRNYTKDVPKKVTHLDIPCVCLLTCRSTLTCRAGRHGVGGSHPDAEERRGHLLPGRSSHQAQHAGLRELVPGGSGALREERKVSGKGTFSKGQISHSLHPARYAKLYENWQSQRMQI